MKDKNIKDRGLRLRMDIMGTPTAICLVVAGNIDTTYI